MTRLYLGLGPWYPYSEKAADGADKEVIRNMVGWHQMRARVAVAASRETCHSCSRKLVITTFGE